LSGQLDCRGHAEREQQAESNEMSYDHRGMG
jgi:hypothetical protein